MTMTCQQDGKHFSKIAFIFCLQILLASASPMNISHKPRPTVFEATPFYPKLDAMAIKALMTEDNYENGFVEILTLRTLKQRLIIAEQYHSLYGEDIAISMDEKLHDNLRELIVTLMTPYDNYWYSELRYAQNSNSSNNNPQRSSLLKTLFRRQTNEQRRATTVAYKKSLGVPLEDISENVLPFVLWNAVTIRPTDAFTTEDLARELREALNGPKVDHHSLIQIVALRSEYDLQNIQEVYQQLYGNSLYQTIQNVLHKETNPRAYTRAFIFLLGFR